MIRIYGHSDDLVVIENSTYEEDEIGCFNCDVRIGFADGTVIRVGYPKKGMAVWWIGVENQGSAFQKLTVCNDEDVEIYSDIFEIESEITEHRLIDKAPEWDV